MGSNLVKGHLGSNGIFTDENGVEWKTIVTNDGGFVFYRNEGNNVVVKNFKKTYFL